MLIEWVKSNVVWIKDVFYILFTCAATLVAVLTYRKAKKTIFQPAVVKRQTELIVELLDYLHTNTSGLFMLEVYYEIIECNLFYQLEEIGVGPTRDNNEVKERMSAIRNGWLIIKSDNVHKFEEICTPSDKAEDENVKTYSETIEDIDDIDDNGFTPSVIYVTNAFQEIKAILAKYAIDPFMPKVLQNLLKQLSSDIDRNIRGAITLTITYSINEILRIYKTSEYIDIEPKAVYNHFCLSPIRIDHSFVLEDIIKISRKYLKVDKL